MQVLTAEIIETPLTLLGNFPVWKRDTRICPATLNATVVRLVLIELVVHFSFKLFFFPLLLGGGGGRGNKPWQISHVKLYDEVLTNRNISDVCVYTARPVKHFRSLVLKICSDIDGLYTNKECNECTLTCSPKPLWVGRYQNQNPKSPFGSLTYVLGAFSLHSIDWITKWIADARLSFPHWLWQWLHPRGNRCVLMESTTYFNWVA